MLVIAGLPAKNYKERSERHCGKKVSRSRTQRSAGSWLKPGPFDPESSALVVVISRVEGAGNSQMKEMEMLFGKF